MNDNFNIAKNFFETGEKLFAEKKFSEAEKNFNLSLKFLPERISTLINLGLCKIKLKQYDQCLEIINQIENLKDSSFDYKNLKSLYYGETLQFNKAIKQIEDMLAIKHLKDFDYSNLLNYLGIAYSKIKNYKKAIELQKKSVELNEFNYEAQANLGFNNLVLGNFKKGWEQYEYRLKMNNLNISKYPKNIQQIKNKNILIRSEQGLGDIIQFSRFLPELYTHSKNITVILPKPLNNFFNYKDIKFLTSGYHDLNLYDYEIYIGSLPYLLKKFDDLNLKDTVLNPEIFEKKLIHQNKKFKIGLAWSGNSNFRYDVMRSLKLEYFKKILSLIDNNVEVYCLQKDIRDCDKVFFENSKIKNYGDFDFFNLSKKIINFDLVISSDTSILHLASTLGIRTFGLISYIPDWRWGLEGNSSHWYKSLKLFRQLNNENWIDVVNKVYDEVKKLI